jgi:drug/metabolite transporter (DMT)-like permease
LNAIVVAAVLGAALLHASWNAMLKSGTDRFLWMTAVCVGQGVIATGALLMLGLPALASWPYVAASAAIHTVYQLLLVRMYAVGDFGQTYPIARGSSPLLVALGAFVVAHEVLSPQKVTGIVLVCGGIMALAFEGRRFHLDRVPAALATGVSIGAYTVVDGVGARLAGNAVAYVAAFSVIWVLAIVCIFIGVRGFALPRLSQRDGVTAFIGGALASTGYATVVWAMTIAPMGLVSALRETSVVFAALIARLFLDEKLTAGRLSACAVIAGGGALLSS